MISAYWVSGSGVEPLADETAATGRTDGFLWLDSDAGDDDADRAALQAHFEPPPEVVAEALAKRHPPKFEGLSDSSFFLLLRGLDADTKSLDFGTLQLALLVGDGVLFTRHTAASPSVERILQRLGKRTVEGVTPIHAALMITEAACNRFLPIVLAIEQRLETLEDSLFEEADDSLLGELTGYRTALKRLRRITAFHESALSSLSKARQAPVDKRDKRLLRECTDSLERSASLQALFHDLCGDLIDSYLALAAHRLNAIMKVLTIVTAIFVPLGFLAGLYGMNFSYIPELGWRYGYFALLGVMATVAGGLLIAFRRFRWL